MKNDSTYIIAEVGQAHDGSLGILHSYIEALAETGVDAIKFQTHIAEAESSQFEPFRVNFSYVDKTRMDYWKRVSFTKAQWQEIKKHCDDVGVDFISSPFSIAAVNMLEEVGVETYKIGSGEVSNLLMLECIGETGKDIILSSGMSDYEEIDRSISFLSKFGSKVSLLQCTTEYPVKAEEIGLNVIAEMKIRYGIDVGLSDHSGKIYPSLSAVSLGATILEFHAVFDRKMFGPDSSSSLTMSEIKQLVEGVRYIERTIKNPVDKNRAGLSKSKGIFGKSLAINKELKAGDIITRSHLESKKPAGLGIPAAEFLPIVGKRLKADKKQWDFLNWEDLDD